LVEKLRLFGRGHLVVINAESCLVRKTTSGETRMTTDLVRTTTCFFTERRMRTYLRRMTSY
jgi:hypothetical protein